MSADERDLLLVKCANRYVVLSAWLGIGMKDYMLPEARAQLAEFRSIMATLLGQPSREDGLRMARDILREHRHA